MVILIIGNILSLIGTICLLYSIFRQSKKNILQFQILDCIFNTMANCILGGFSGAIVILMALIRNILIFKNKMTNTLMVIILLLMVIIGLSVNKNGYIGLLPIIANIEYTLWLSYGNNIRNIKIALAINVFLWAIYDFTIQAYPSSCAEIFILITTIYAICKKQEDSKIKATNP